MTEVNEVNIERGRAMAEGGGGGGGKIKKILLVVIVLAVVAGGGYFLVDKFLLGGESAEEMAAKDSRGAGDSDPTSSGGPRLGSAGAQDNPTGFVEDPQYLELGSFVVNLRDGRRYLKVNIQVVLSNEDAKIFLEKRIADVKHVVLSTLQSLSSAQMKNPADRASLIIDLMDKIHTLFPPDKEDIPGDDNRPIKKVLFTEFYLQ